MTDRDRKLPRVDASLAALLRIAGDLRDLPRKEFRAGLKRALQAGPAGGSVKAVPPGYHTATPCLVIRNAANALDFYKQAFGATELVRHADPSGKILHAEFQVGDSRIAVADEAPEWGNHSPQSLGGSPVILSLYVEDVDALAERAVTAGARVIFPVADQFYGDRSGRLADPFGHVWIVSTHKEDVSPEELQRRVEAQTAEHEPVAPPIAAGSYRVETYLPVRGATKLIDFLQRAFAAEETSRAARPDGTIAHAEIKIGDSTIGLGDATDVEPSPAALHLYVDDVDAAYRRALDAGATSIEKPSDQDYGERGASIEDRFGNHWYIATQFGDKPVPAGLPNMMPYLHPHGAPQLIDFMKRAFGAEERFRAQSPDGVVHHAKIRIGESVVEMGEAHGPYQPMPTVFHLYVNDTDAAYRRAVAAGAVPLGEPANQPWGYRSAGVQDPSGNQWWINAPTERVSAEDTPEPVEATPTPPTHHSVTPFLHVRDVRKTVDLLKDAFGADLISFDRGGDPPHDHADIRIGDSMMMVGELTPGFAATSSAFYLHVDDVDVTYHRALAAGATSQQAPKEMPWGHRMAHVRDPLGNSWFIAAHRKSDTV